MTKEKTDELKGCGKKFLSNHPKEKIYLICGDIAGGEIVYCQECKARQEEREKMKKEIKEDTNPDEAFPTDVFPELTDKQLADIHFMLKEKFGFPLDRLSAHIGRKHYKNFQEIINKKAGDKLIE